MRQISIGELQERLLAALEKIKKIRATSAANEEQQTEFAPSSPNHAPALLAQKTEGSLLTTASLNNTSSLLPEKEAEPSNLLTNNISQRGRLLSSEKST